MPIAHHEFTRQRDPPRVELALDRRLAANAPAKRHQPTRQRVAHGRLLTSEIGDDACTQPIEKCAIAAGTPKMTNAVAQQRLAKAPMHRRRPQLYDQRLQGLVEL